MEVDAHVIDLRSVGDLHPYVCRDAA